MVSEMVDYIGAATGIVLVFVAAIFFFSGMVTNGVAFAAQRNDALQAQNLFDYILLTPGSPADWGTSSNAIVPTAFGLSTPDASNPYYLDAGSLIRLMPPVSSVLTQLNGKSYYNLTVGNVTILLPTDYYLNYTYTKQLLNITGKFDFQLTMTPALNITVKQGERQGNVTFHVQVSSYTGAPMSYAAINGTLVYAENATQSGPPSIGFATESNVTNVSGKGELVFPVPNSWVTPPNSTYYVLVNAEAGGVTGEGFSTNNQLSRTLAYLSVFEGGQNITVIQHCSVSINPSCGKDYFSVEVLLPTEQGSYAVEPVVCNTDWINAGGGGGNQHSYSTCTGLFTDGVAVVAIAQTGSGQQSTPQILLAPLGLSAQGLRLVYGGNPTGAATAVSLSRVVQVDGVTYVASFVYWPDVGPVFGGE